MRRRESQIKLENQEKKAPVCSSLPAGLITAGAGEMEGTMTFMKRIDAARAGMTQAEKDTERLEWLKTQLRNVEKHFAEMGESNKDFFRAEHELRTRDLRKDIAKLEV